MSLAVRATAASRPERCAAWIASVQDQSGMICWFPGGHGDPWNHVEAAMALASAGEHAAAARAYEWLVANQASDGAFAASFTADGSIREQRRDTNATAYLACGVYHQVMSTNDVRVARRFYPSVEAALDFALAHERAEGGIAWSIETSGERSAEALVAASSAIALSLGAGAALARLVGADHRRFARARARISRAVARHPEVFADKSVFAMDWYYPVLAGALSRPAARRRLRAGWPRFGEAGGVRCRADGRWVTAAESAECAIACWRIGWTRSARRLLAATAELCGDDGAVRTGVVHPDRTDYPPGEVTTYSAAAVVLAHSALRGGSTARLFSL